MRDNFNNKHAEYRLAQAMKAVSSPENTKKALQDAADAGVMVPSVRDADGTGYDIFSLLLKERIIIVNGQVEPAMAAVIIAQLKFLDAIGSDKPIAMWINSPGGSVIDGQAIYDVMRSI